MKPGERVLITAWDPRHPLAAWSQAVEPGLIVVLAGPEDIHDARRAHANLENVMFTSGGRDDIPWRDGSFSMILDQDPANPTQEMKRALCVGGVIRAPEP